MSRPPFTCLVIFAFFAQFTSAQQTYTTVQRDPQAVATVQGSLAALGGATQPAPTSIVASGTYTRFLSGSTVSYPLRVEVLGFDKYRWEIDTPDEGTINEQR